MIQLAVIIARAGSKGLPNKAMQSLAGKPVIVWTIEHALQCKQISHVVLTSDCPQICALGEQYHLHTYRRPVDLAGDQTTIDAAVRHGVTCWEKEFGQQADTIGILYGNVPLRPNDLTDRAMSKLIDSGAHSVQSVYNVGKMHPLWMKKLAGESGDELVMYKSNKVYRRQDLPPVYMLDAGILAVTRASLFAVDENEPHAFLGTDRRAVVTQAGEVADIDNAADLAVATALLEMRKSCDES